MANTTKSLKFSTYQDKDLSPVFFPSGSTLLDLALGGGWIEDRFINLIGDFGTGKSLMAIQAAAGYVGKYPERSVYYLDYERAFNIGFAESVGLPRENTKFPQELENTVESLSIIIEWIIKNDPKSLVIVDSLDSVSTAEELDADKSGGYGGARKAGLMSEFFRRLNAAMSDSDTTLFVISQIRQNIGVVYGRQWRRAGGKALDFYASQMALFKPVAKITRTYRGVKRVTGTETLVAIEKNRLGKPFRSITLPLFFEAGINDVYANILFLKKTDNLDKWLKNNRISGKNLPILVERVSSSSDLVLGLKNWTIEVWNDIESGLVGFDDTGPDVVDYATNQV